MPLDVVDNDDAQLIPVEYHINLKSGEMIIITIYQ